MSIPAGAAPKYKTLQFDLVHGTGVKECHLEFHNVRHPEESLEVRAFINKPDATEATPLDDPHFAGQLFLLGHGKCAGEVGHCSPELAPRRKFDLRPPHPLTPFDTFLDVTDAMKQVGGADGKNTVTLIVTDVDDHPVPEGTAQFDGLSLVAKG